MGAMRLTLAALLVTLLTPLVPAEPSGLSSAIERQRQDLATQQGEMRREMERQRGSLQQQQERNLQFQLLQRQQLVPPPAPSNCAQIAGAFVCR
jgi:hypothetical protein